ncbi:MAG: hypothetical protein ACM359_19075 [Bacillota bacterium]
MNTTSFARWVILIIACIATAGCGPQDYTVLGPDREAELMEHSDIVVEGRSFARQIYVHNTGLLELGPTETMYVQFSFAIDRVIKGEYSEAELPRLTIRPSTQKERLTLDPRGIGFPPAFRIGFDRGLLGKPRDLIFMPLRPEQPSTQPTKMP